MSLRLSGQRENLGIEDFYVYQSVITRCVVVPEPRLLSVSVRFVEDPCREVLGPTGGTHVDSPAPERANAVLCLREEGLPGGC